MISRCYVSGFGGGGASLSTGNLAANITIENNVINGPNVYLGTNTGYILRNNIIRCPIVDYNSDANSIYVKNNLFLCTAGGSPFSQMKNDVFENNIFYGGFPSAGDNNQTCTFNNNYVFGVGVLPYGTSVGSGNITNTDALFSSYTCGTTFTFSENLRPVAGHAVINAGTDGTDIGITGGAAPFYRYPAPYPMTGEAAIPQITEITIPVSSVPAGGTLNINVKARKRN